MLPESGRLKTSVEEVVGKAARFATLSATVFPLAMGVSGFDV